MTLIEENPPVKMVERPIFDSGQIIGGFDLYQVVADQAGVLWHINIESGHAVPVTFSTESKSHRRP